MPALSERHLGTAAVVAMILGLAASACGSDGQARVVVETSDGRVTVTATAEAGDPPSAGERSPEASPSPAASPPGGLDPNASATPVQIPAEGTATPAAPATPASTPGLTPTPTATPEPEAADLPGAPHSTADVREAVEARGQGFTPVGGARGCEGTSVPPLRFWSRDPGSTAGPAFVLWVYPDSSARSADWDTSSGIVLPRVSGCTLPSSATYWNGNAVISFDGYIDDGAPAPRPPGSMRSHAVIDAFLSMAR